MQGTDETLGGRRGGVLGRGGQAGLEVLDDVGGEHLEVEQEVLLSTQQVEVRLGTVHRVEEEGVLLLVCQLKGQDLGATCLLCMQNHLNVEQLCKILTIL